MIFATAFEPYQELFQGVVVCLHADFRLGGLKPGETKQVPHGKIYLLPNDVPALLKRYEKDFPEQVEKVVVSSSATRDGCRPGRARANEMIGARFGTASSVRSGTRGLTEHGRDETASDKWSRHRRSRMRGLLENTRPLKH